MLSLSPKPAGGDPWEQAVINATEVAVTSDPIRRILEQLERGGLDVAAAAAQLELLSASATAATAEAQVDLDRQRRCGFPEVVFCEGKTSEAIVEIFEAMSRHGQNL